MATTSSPEMINLRVTSNISSLHSERRFPADQKIGELKGKLELLTGVNSGGMTVELKDPDTNAFIASLEDDSMTLTKAGCRNGLILHVRDTSGVSSLINIGTEGEDTIAKFEMSEDVYSQRTDSVRAWKQREKLGRFDPKSAAERAEKDAQLAEESKEAAGKITVGARCETRLPGQPAKRGTVRFVGDVHFKPGAWVGVEYDEPLGKNDGAVDGKRYFTCPAKYGGFVRAQDVTIGDFPEENLMDDDDDGEF